jgi:hypothetical protein
MHDQFRATQRPQRLLTQQSVGVRYQSNAARMICHAGIISELRTKKNQEMNRRPLRPREKTQARTEGP